MITLNLLSPQRKEALRFRILYAVIERLMIMLVAATLVTTAVMTVVKIELTRTLSDVLSRQVLSKEYVSANNDTGRLNRAVDSIARTQLQTASMARLVEEVAKRTPAGAAVENLDFDVKSRSLRLSGKASTRDVLLAYSEALRASPMFETVDLPLSNLFQRTEISFQINMLVRIEELRKYPVAPKP
jgi:Tfp pilus assembly protein PilN